MILRDAIVSEQRRTIGRAHRHSAASAAATALESPLTAGSDGALAKEESEAYRAVFEPVPPAAHAARESGLTFEAVAAWLAVQDAQTRAACASILADELTQVHESAKAEGFAAGQVHGREEARQATHSLLATLEALAHSAQAALAQEQMKLAELCVEIVAETFAKIAGPLLPTRDAAVGAVAEVLKRVKEGRELTVRVSPADLPMLREAEDRLAAALPGRKLSLLADSRVDVGGCIVDSNLGSLDGRLEVQLRALYETLRAAKSAQAERP